MVPRKGINMPFLYMYGVFKKIEGSDKVVFSFLFKTQRPSDTVF